MRTGTVVLIMLAAGSLYCRDCTSVHLDRGERRATGPSCRRTRQRRGELELRRSAPHAARTRDWPVSAGRPHLDEGRGRPTTVPGLPFAKVTRRGPDGRLYALQTWRVEPNGHAELHFSRWQGAPTTVELTAEAASGSERLVGRARFQGKPVAGYSRTNSGIRYRIFAFLDCVGAQGRRGVVSAASRHALTERFGYWSSPRTSAGVTA